MYPISSARRVAALVVACALLSGAGSAMAAPAPQPRTDANVRLDDEPGTRGRDTPGLAVNPADANHIVAVEVDVLDGRCKYKVSFDRGRTWDGGDLRGPEDFPSPDAGYPAPLCDGIANRAMDGSVAFGSGNTVYVPFASTREGDENNYSVLVAKSTDGGRTFGRATVVMGRAKGGPSASLNFTRPELTVERRAEGDRIYVAAQRTATAPVSQGFVSRSTDGGATWTDPVSVSTVHLTEPSEPVVDRNSHVFVAWRSSGDVDGTVRVSKSTDLGQTWTVHEVANVRGYGPDAAGSQFNASTFPRMATDPTTGNLYIVYMQGPNPPPPPGSITAQDHFIHSDADVYFVRSTDGGVTWSPQGANGALDGIRINQDPPKQFQAGRGPNQRHPKIAVAPNGRIDIVWQDRRHGYRSPTNSHLGNGEARLGDTYYRYSTDGGLTFAPERRVSDESQNLDIGLDYRAGIYWNYSPALAPLGNDEVLFAWQDSREGNFDSETEDIYLAHLNHRPAGGTPVQRLPEAPNSALSVELSRLAYTAGAEAILNVGFTNKAITHLVIVNEEDAASALAGAVLARAFLGSLLLTPSARLPLNVVEEVRRMSPEGAFVIGDESKVSGAVVSDLVNAGVAADRITRIAGASPADVAAAVVERMHRPRDGMPDFDAAVIVNPASREAATVAGLAAARRLPVLFVDRNSVPAATTRVLEQRSIPKVLVIGGENVISPAVAAQVSEGRAVERLASPSSTENVDSGDPAFETSKAVLEESIEQGLPTNIVYVANTQRPIDAAVLGAAVGRVTGVMLLTPNAATGAVSAALGGVLAGADRVVVAKGTGPTSLLGYRLIARDGGVFAFGSAPFLGSTGGIRLNRPIVGGAATQSGNGYWLVAEDGGIFNFGDAGFQGSLGNLRLNQPIVGMAATPSGAGYWLVARDGGVFAFGDAGFHGSTGGIRLNQPIAGIAGTPSGRGYWLVAQDGGIFAFGDAVYAGSTGGIRLNQPIAGMAPAPGGDGYWLVARDGGIFAFGSAPFLGSTGSIRLSQPIAGMAPAPGGDGYWLVAQDGGIFAFGSAPFLGSTGSIRLSQPIVGMAAAR